MCTCVRACAYIHNVSVIDCFGGQTNAQKTQTISSTNPSVGHGNSLGGSQELPRAGFVSIRTHCLTQMLLGSNCAAFEIQMLSGSNCTREKSGTQATHSYTISVCFACNIICCIRALCMFVSNPSAGNGSAIGATRAPKIRVWVRLYPAFVSKFVGVYWYQLCI